jgi:hypothetical protein
LWETEQQTKIFKNYEKDKIALFYKLPEKGIISQKVISSRGLFYKVDT